MVRIAAVLVVASMLVVPLGGCISGVSPGSDGNSTDPVENDTEARSFSGLAAPVNESELGHVHDRWGSKDKLPLVDRSIRIEALRTSPSGIEDPDDVIVGCDDYGIFFSTTCLGRTTFRPEAQDERRVVPPGTAALEATVTWEDPAISGVQLWFNPAYVDRWLTLGQFGSSGEEETVRSTQYNPDWDSFPLDWTDDGHAQATRWTFAATAYAGGEPYAVADGSVDVSIDVERTDGDLPYEPPHPDWFGNTSSYRVIEAERWYNETWEQTQVWWFNRWNYMFWFHSRNPVPPGTREVLIDVNLTNHSPTADVDELRSTVDMWYWTDGFWRYGEWPPGDAPSEKTRDGDQVRFRIVPEPRETDSVYACGPRDSMWGFLVWVHPPSVDDPVFPTSHPTVQHYDGRIGIDGAATDRTDASLSSLTPADAEGVPGCEFAKEAYNQ